MSFRPWIAAALAVGLTVPVTISAPVAASSPRPLGSASDAGPRAGIAYLSDNLPRPKALRVTVRAKQGARVKGRYWVSCGRNGTKFKRAGFPITRAGTYRARPTLKRATSCRIIAVVSHADPTRKGSIRISVTGRSAGKPPRVPAAGTASGPCAPLEFQTGLTAIYEGTQSLSTLITSGGNWQGDTWNLQRQARQLWATGLVGATLYGADAPTVIQQFQELQEGADTAASSVQVGGVLEDTLMDMLLAQRYTDALQKSFGLPLGASSFTPQFTYLFHLLVQDWQDALFLLDAFQETQGWTNWPAKGQTGSFARQLYSYYPVAIVPLLEQGFVGQSVYGVDASEVLTSMVTIDAQLRAAATTQDATQAQASLTNVADDVVALVIKLDQCTP